MTRTRNPEYKDLKMHRIIRFTSFYLFEILKCSCEEHHCMCSIARSGPKMRRCRPIASSTHRQQILSAKLTLSTPFTNKTVDLQLRHTCPQANCLPWVGCHLRARGPNPSSSARFRPASTAGSRNGS